MSQFVIFALPRSRTAWMAKFLAYQGRFGVGHDITIECKSPDDFFRSFELGMTGTVETAAVLAWQLILHRLPKAKIVVVKRPIDEVKRSLLQFGITPVPGELETRDAMLDALSKVPGVETLEYSDLCIPQCCQWLFEHCLETEFDEQWWMEMAQTNFQVNMAWQLSRLITNDSDLRGLRSAFLSQMKELSLECQPGLN